MTITLNSSKNFLFSKYEEPTTNRPLTVDGHQGSNSDTPLAAQRAEADAKAESEKHANSVYSEKERPSSGLRSYWVPLAERGSAQSRVSRCMTLGASESDAEGTNF